MNFKKIAACAAAALTLVCSATAMSASAAEKMYAFKLGDVNGDKRIDVTDVSMINAHIRGYYPIKTDKGMGAADVNFDGKIDVEDFNAVSDELLGKKPLAHGDVNGDGIITKPDVDAVKNHVTKKKLLTKGQQINAKVDDFSNKVDFDDYAFLLAYYYTYAE